MVKTRIGPCAYCDKKPVTLTHLVKTSAEHHEICEDCAVTVKDCMKNQMEVR